MTKDEYERLHSIVFRGDYPGYKPEVRELPNGDGKVDAEKRYAHIATKYIEGFNPQDAVVLIEAMLVAHDLAERVATALRVPATFNPCYFAGALRVLEYPVGATSNLHTDFDLFTLMIYRDQPEKFIAHHKNPSNWRTRRTLPPAFENLQSARKLNAQLHIGELGELLGLGPATPHEVLASDTTQHSVVYFAIPDHAAVLPTGQTVGAWLDARIARSRTYK